jgi:hypothetical protein
MAMPALKLEAENPVEERIARLETHAEHMQSDISLLQTNVGKLNDKVDALKESMNKGFAEIDKQFLKLKIARIADRVWFLLTAGMILGVMAHGFKWL